jgi:uncharacterized protein (DUF488 family)
MATAFFTIGHSTRAADEFVALLEAAAIRVVADVRKMPGSRANPQYDGDRLCRTLAKSGIRYRHIAPLGGLRSRQGAMPSPNTFWQNRSFRNYADYALTVEFREGLDELMRLGREQCCAVMCAEAVWWRCHRRIIADYLLVAGYEVFHIMGPGQTHPASLTPAARPNASGGLIYPGGAEAAA